MPKFSIAKIKMARSIKFINNMKDKIKFYHKAKEKTTRLFCFTIFYIKKIKNILYEEKNQELFWTGKIIENVVY